MAREKPPKIGQINLVNNLKKSPPEFLSSAFVHAERIHNKDPFAQPLSDDVGWLARDRRKMDSRDAWLAKLSRF